MNGAAILFTDWSSLVRTAIVGFLAYFVLIAILQVSGNRTLSKMNAFDLIVTVALGSTLASALLDKSVTLADGTLALALLVSLQMSITWSSVRSRWVREIISNKPQLLLYRGELLQDAMLRTRFTDDEVRAAVRAAGILDLHEVEAVVLETNGTLSVVRRSGECTASSLVGVQRPDADPDPASAIRSTHESGGRR